MKKLQSLFLLAFVVLLSSCTSNETNTTISETDIIGTWNLTEFKLENGNISYTENGITLSSPYSLEGSDFNATLTFSDTPKVITVDGYFTLKTTATFLGQTQTEEGEVNLSDAPTDLENVNWSLAGDVLTISVDGEDQIQAEIISFNGSTLRLKTIFNELFTDENDNATIKGDIYITLEK